MTILADIDSSGVAQGVSFAPLRRLYDSFVDLLPTIVLALVIVVVGAVLAATLAYVLRRMIHGSKLEALMERAGVTSALYRIGYREGVASFAAVVARSVVYLITLLVAVDTLGLTQIARGLDSVVAYLPRVGIAALFLVLGLRLAELLKSMLISMSARSDQEVSAPRLVANALYYVVAAITIALVADQLGLQTDLINNVILLVLAAVALAAAGAFALGSRETMANLLARNYVTQLYPRGDMVVVEGVRYLVRAHAPTVLVLEADGFRRNVPYVLFMREAFQTSSIDPSGNGADDRGEEASE